ncbi:MAG: hypothetical protein WCA85_15570 [Paraburkholderia sp.]|uniref:hypothetical protein n=1 Tax=Paraburkholderia sp. TaxID=1926495 RepID=UPI003C47CC8F
MGNIDEQSIAPFKPWTLIRYVDAPVGHVMRYLGWDSELDQIAFLEIKSKKPPASKLPTLHLRGELFSNRDAWEVVSECICPQWMAGWDDSKNKDSKDNARRDEKFAQIQAILVHGNNEVLFSDSARNRLIKRAAKKSRVSEQWIRKLLAQYWFYGARRNSLLPRRREQGAPGESRVDVNTKKPGRPLATIKMNPRTKLRGARMTRELLDKWEAFLIRRAAEIHSQKGQVGLAAQFSLTELWDEFRDTELIEEKKRNETLVKVPIPLYKLPRKRRFIDYGKEIWKKNILMKYFVNEADWLAKKARLGHATDHTRARVTIYELDGLLFNAELLWGENSLNPQGVGKAVVMLCACVETTAIVGVHVTVQNESANAYRNCLFNAFSQKTELLETMKLENLAGGFVHGSSDEVRFDRGPGKSRGLVNPLIDDAKIGVRFARARRGRDKSIVEAVNRFIQEKLKSLPGFYVRSRSGHDKDAKAKSERWARIQFEEFVELVLTFVHDWNTTRNVFDRLPDWMVKDGNWKGNLATPKGFFDFLRDRRLADAAVEWSPQETYANLIEARPVKVSEGSVAVGSARYDSDELKRLWNMHVSTPSGKHDELWINVKPHPDTNHFVVWSKENGKIEQLNIMPDSGRRFGRNVWLTHEFRNTAKAVSRYESETGARNAKLPAKMRQVIAAAKGLPKRPRSPAGAKSVNRRQKAEFERLEAERRACKTFDVDLPENQTAILQERVTGRYNPDHDERFAGDI